MKNGNKNNKPDAFFAGNNDPDLMNTGSISSVYEKQARFKFALMFLCFLSLTAIAVLSLCVGSSGLTIKEVFSAFFLFDPSTVDSSEITKNNIIWKLRMPRIFMAILTGAGLSLCGSVMQGLTRNPLVSPYTTGISSAAAFGASVAIMFGKTFLGIPKDVFVVICAFISSMVCAILVYIISSSRGMRPVILVLLGTALTFLFGAFTSTIQFISNEFQLESIVRWTFGSFTGADWMKNSVLFIILLLCFFLFMHKALHLNVMSSFNDEVSKGLGINVSSTRALTGIASVILTSCIVSFTGIIGFVGIVAPHIARITVGGDYRFLLPFSVLYGAVLILIADTAGRTLFAPIIIPVGIVVAYVGAPIFIHLIISSKKEYFE
jgi:iron complex transport system permease protein